MTAYKFNPTTYSSPTDWNTPADWLPGVPNASDADVTIPLITGSSAGNFDLTVSQGESFAVRSVALTDLAGQTLVINGTLAISGALTLGGATAENAYNLYPVIVGGTLQIGSLSNVGPFRMRVSGLLTSANAIVNNGTIVGPGTLQLGGLTNAGTLDGVTLAVPGGTLTNLVNGTLTGGTYAATSAALTLGVGDDIVTDAATIVVGNQRVQTTGRTGTIDTLGQTLQAIAAGGVLNDVGSYTQSAALLDAGMVELNGGLDYTATLTSAGITVASGGTVLVTGRGTVTGPVVIQSGGSVQVAFYLEDVGIPAFQTDGDLVLTGPVSGPGTLVFQPTPSFYPYKELSYLNTIELGGLTSSDVSMGDQNDTLVIDNPALFTGRIANFQSGLDLTNGRFYDGQTATHSDAVIEDGVSLSSVSSYSYAGATSGGTLTVQETNGSSFALNFLGNYITGNFILTDVPQSLSTLPSNLSITYNAHPNAAQDFNGDGTSDLVLQNDNGAIVLLTTQLLAATGSYSFGNPGGSWHAVGIADFDGNGTPDLLLQNDNGAVVDYLTLGGNATQVAGGFLLDNPGSGWHVRGTGDFNGDGKADFVLQNDSGLIVVDYTNGGAVIGRDVISNPGPSWTVEAVGDLNGDGRPDLLLQNSNGALVDYLMTGAKPVAGYLLSGPSTGYSVAGIGDYNGDGFGDIVLHNDGGADVILDTRGAIVSASSAPVGNPGATWTNVTPGVDLNGDGTADLVLGQNGAFVGVGLNGTGTAPTMSATLAAPGPGWRSIGGTPMEFIDGTGATLAPLSGTPGADEFNLTSIGASGLHTINGFDPAIDLVALSVATFANYAAVQAVEQPYMGGTYVALPNASSVMIAGVDPSLLTAANFVLR